MISVRIIKQYLFNVRVSVNWYEQDYNCIQQVFPYVFTCNIKYTNHILLQ